MFLLRRRITWLSATRTTGEEVRSANWSSGCYRGYRAACWKTTQLIAESYTRNRVSEAILSGQPRKLWSVVNKLLHHGSNIGDLCNNDSKRLANNFSRFFNDKLTNLLFKISSALPQSCASINFPSHPMGSVPSTNWSVFTPTTPEEVYKIICSMANKTSPLDIIPTPIIESCALIFCCRQISICHENCTGHTPPEKTGYWCVRS